MQKHKNGVVRSHQVFQHVFMQMKNDSCNYRMEELRGDKRVYKQAADILLHSSDGYLFFYDVLIQHGPLLSGVYQCMQTQFPPPSHMSLSIGGGCVMLHISTRDPSFSCRLGL